MRRLIGACALVASLAACSREGGETITAPDGPFGGVYSLRQMNDSPLPLYFSPAWYPGRGTSPGSQATTLLSGDLFVRSDGTYTWTTMLEEVTLKSQTVLTEFVVLKVRREANGKWTYSPATGAVSLEGTDQFGAYVLTGSATTGGLTLTSSFAGRANSTFVLER